MKRWGWLSIGIVLLAFGLRVPVTTHALPYVHHIDEPNFYRLAQDWRGQLNAGWRNNWLAGYPPGYIHLYAATMNGVDTLQQLDLHRDMYRYVFIMRMVSVFADVFILVLLMWLIRDLSTPLASLLGGLFYALSAEFIQYSALAQPDPITTLLVLLTVIASVQALRHHSGRWALMATILGLLATIFKYSAGPILLLPACYYLRDLWRRRWRAVPGGALALGLVMSVAYYLLFVEGGASLDNSEGAQARLYFWQNLTNPRRWENVLHTIFGSIGWGPIGLATMGLVGWLLRPRLKRDESAKLAFPAADVGWIALGSLCILVLVPIYMAQLGYWVRYIWPVAVLWIVIAATLYGHFAGFWRGFVWITVALALAYLSETATFVIEHYTRPHTFTIAQRWFADNVPAGSVIWIESEPIYRSLSRYDGGYTGVPEFERVYLSNDEMLTAAVSATLDYAYLNAGQIVGWPRQDTLPPRDALTLLKRFESATYLGEPAYVFTFDPVARQDRNIVWQSGDTTLILEGIAATRSPDGTTIDINSYWRVGAALPSVDYSYMVYLAPFDDPTAVRLQHDGPLGQRRTSTWDDPDELLRGEIAPLGLPDDLPAGAYRLGLVVYYWATGERLRLPNGETTYWIDTLTLNAD